MRWDALWISLRVAGSATLIIFVLGLVLALWLARRRFRGQVLVETLVTLPLVLPPSVLGYYLLVMLGQQNPLVRALHVQVLFTWPAATIAAAMVGLPLMVQSARAALTEIDPEMENAARMEGASEAQVLRFVTLPLARRGILAGLVLGAARALGEFGATLMVAGNIPGRTQTLPMAIYDAVQSRDYASANIMVVVMTSLAFLVLWAVQRLNQEKSAPAQRRIHHPKVQTRSFGRALQLRPRSHSQKAPTVGRGFRKRGVAPALTQSPSLMDS
ncbi:MAG: molybdate ABC transporter permease subunit [Caldilineae bacterium]|nr:MAG: molybdate ABC transporter permease subunit [Caldilineae bacterium]